MNNRPCNLLPPNRPCNLLPPSPSSSMKSKVQILIFVGVFIILFALDIYYHHKANKVPCPENSKQVTPKIRSMIGVTGLFGALTFVLFLALLYTMEREHLHHLRVAVNDCAYSRQCPYKSSQGAGLSRYGGSKHILNWTKLIIGFKVVIIIFMFAGLFVIPLHTMYKCGRLPIAAGGALLSCGTGKGTPAKGNATQPQNALRGYAKLSDNIVRYMMAVWMSVIWVAITFQMIHTTDVVMKSYLQLALIGISIALFAAISSAMSVNDVQASAEVAYSI